MGPKQFFVPEEVTFRQIRQFSQRLARKVRDSNFMPDFVVGIEVGGHLLGNLVAHELGVPLETVVVRRRTTSLMRSSIVRRFYATRMGKTVGKVLDRLSNYGGRPVKKVFLGALREHQRILVVDDGTNTGKTMAAVKRVLLAKGAAEANIKTACVTAESAGYRPDFYLTVKPIYWPWSVFSRHYEVFRKWRKKQLRKATMGRPK
jgi:hypoxanthine phosphoribosyltransferase